MSARRRSVLLAALLPLVAMACGVPTDSEPRPIPDERVPFGLLDPEPTSTTAPRPAGGAASVGVTVFLVAGQRLAAVPRDVPAPASPQKALAALLAGATSEEAARDLRTAVGTPADVSVTVAGGLARVELGSPFATTGTREQVLAVAQIVYTLTAFPGVEAVAFTLAGRPVEVPAGDGTLTTGAMRRSDFESVAQL